ncbi:MAG: hypothetical protein ABJF23_05795 [Bryobacteraceae bacterium]
MSISCILFESVYSEQYKTFPNRVYLMEAHPLQVTKSKKGTYLAVMAVSAVLFVLFLFVAPSFLYGETVPPFVYGIVVVATFAVAVGLWLWRNQIKKRNPLDREEGKVSGQIY